VNVSETGILFQSPRRWREGTILRVTLRGEDGILPFFVSVARCEPIASDDPNCVVLVGAATRFDGHADARSRWTRFVEKLAWAHDARTPIAFRAELPPAHPTPVFVDVHTMDELDAVKRKIFGKDGHVFWPSSQAVADGTPVSLVFVHPMNGYTLTQPAIVTTVGTHEGSTGWWHEIVDPDPGAFAVFVESQHLFSEVTEAIEEDAEY